MKIRPVSLLLLAAVCLLGLVGSGEAQCRPDGDFKFVCGLVSPEDLVAVPNSAWASTR